MKVLVILGHQRPGSFCHAITDTAVEQLQANGHETIVHDLYDERFDPILPDAEIGRDVDIDPVVQKHCDELMAADGYLVVHPNWWAGPPAILKGWVDRVIRPGVAYKFLEGDGGEGVPVGLLKARAAIVFNTSNTPPEREHAVFGDPLELIWKKCVFDLCGVVNVCRETFCVVVTSTPEQRAQWLEKVRETLAAHFPPEAQDPGGQGE